MIVTKMGFTINIITKKGNFPDDVIISDSREIIGSYKHPVLLSTGEFMELFDEMASLARLLIIREALRDESELIPDKDPKKQYFNKRMRSIYYNDRDRVFDDKIALYFKIRLLRQGYNQAANEMKKSRFNSHDFEDKIKKWAKDSEKIYRKLIMQMND